MTRPARAGIETMYAGTRFRSRLEARWACFFDGIKWRWEYEPFDADGYIPDFLVFGVQQMLVEVKPASSVRELMDEVPKIRAALEWEWKNDFMLVGATPFLPGGSWWGDDCVVGLMKDGDWFPDDWGDDTWAEACWATCLSCREQGKVCERVFHSVHSFACRPCGHHEGDHHLGDPWIELLEDRWASARNLTQWRPQ